MHCGHPLASAMPDATVLDATADDFVMLPASVPGGGAVPVFTRKEGWKGEDCLRHDRGLAAVVSSSSSQYSMYAILMVWR